MRADEEWRPVLGYEGMYEVSDLGRVRSVERRVPYKGGWRDLPGKVLRQTLTSGTGYPKVALSRDSSPKTHHVHRLVAIAFVEGMGPGMEVCHRDGNRGDPAALNLKWGTRADNMQDAIEHGTNGMLNRTHCPKRHEYTPENTRVYQGRRFCKACKRASYLPNAPRPS